MSARTPFIPSAPRPASRATNSIDQAQNANINAAQSQFVPDQANPLHRDAIKTKLTIENHSNSHGPGESRSFTPGPASHVNKPLNIAGLIKKKISQRSAPGIPSSTESIITRPSTTDPYAKPSQNQTVKILAPTPRSPVSPFLSSDHTSVTFAVPAPVYKEKKNSSSAGHVSPDFQTSNDAHILTTNLGFASAHTAQGLSRTGSDFTSNVLAPATLRSSDATVDQNCLNVETVHTDIARPRFALDTTLPNQTGPQRVLINLNGDPSDNVNTLSPDVNNDGFNLEGHMLKANRNKRTRVTTIEDDPEDYGAPTPAKKYKIQQPQHLNNQEAEHTRTTPFSRHPSPDSGRSGPYRSDSGSGSGTANARSFSHRRPSRQHASPNQQHQQHESQHQRRNDNDGPTPSALDKLLGLNTDAFVQAHIEKYDQALNRWKDCSMEEWVAGADELVEKFGKTLDFVKQHMSNKLKLFASFDNKVDTHSDILKEREKILAGARERVVMESGKVLGTGL